MRRKRLSDIHLEEKGDAILSPKGGYGFQRNLGMRVISDAGICTVADLQYEEQTKIVGIEGGQGIRRSFSLIGVSEGCVVRMISSHGPVTVEIDRNVGAISKDTYKKLE